MMNTANLLTEKLPLLINELHQAGYNIGTPHLILAQNLILSLAQQKQLPPHLVQLKTRLAPILCHSPTEQEEFGWRFENWINKIEKSKEKGSSAENIIFKQQPPKPVFLKKWVIRAIVFIAVLTTANLVFYQLMSPEPETPSQKPSIPTETNEKIDTSSTISNPKPPPEKPSSKELLIDNSQIANDAPKEKTTLFELLLSNWWIIFVSSLSSALIIVLLWRLWRFWQELGRSLVQHYLAQFYLTRKFTFVQPAHQKLFIQTKKLEKDIFQSIKLSHTAQQLHRHIAHESNNLDIVATIKKTIATAGWFTPVNGCTLQRPEYLVLIDRLTFKDHQAKLINSLIDQLSDEGIFINRYYFDADPRYCYPEEDFLPPLTLTELADRHPEHRLFIFSDGEGFVHPVTGQLVSWLNQFWIWPHRTLFLLESPEQWEYTQLLEEQNFLVIPANETGLQFWVEQINTGTQQSFHQTSFPNDTEFVDFPPLLSESPRRWLENYAPDPTGLDELLTQVRLFLGQDGYYWFSAGAVYPELHWVLTLYLGEKLTSEDGKALLKEQTLAKLARLPWFRYGYMPHWLRERLVEDLLVAKKDEPVRAAIEAFLQPKSEEPAKISNITVATEQPSTDGKLLQEKLFVMFMQQPAKSDFKIPPALYNLFKIKVIPSVSDKFSFGFRKMMAHLNNWFYPITSHWNVIFKWLLPILLFSLAIWTILFWLPEFAQSPNFYPPPMSPIKSFFVIVGILFVLVALFQKLFFWLISLIKPVKSFYQKFPSVFIFTSNLCIGLSISLLSIIYSPWLMSIEDAYLDFAMEVRQDEISSAKAKNIPPFVFLDIDNQTHRRWGEPLYTPRNKVKELIEVAVKGEARLVIVDIDVSQKAFIEGLLQPGLQLHPYDQELYDYIANYHQHCDQRECPPIILARAFRPLSNIVQEKESILDRFHLAPEPIREARTGFLETAVAKSAPYVQWASPLFFSFSYDNVIRRSQLWQPICTNNQPEVLPSIQLLAATMIRQQTPQQAQEILNNALLRFKPQNCETYISPLVSSQPIKIAEGLEITAGKYGIHQRIMFNLPWRPPQSINDRWTVRYFLQDYNKETQERQVILTVYSAQSYLNSYQFANAGGALKDKIVLIGGSYNDGGNIHPTPLGNMLSNLVIIKNKMILIGSNSDGNKIHSAPLGDMPGGLVIINAIHSLLQYGEIQPLSSWENFGWSALSIVVMSLIFLFIGDSFWWVMVIGIITVWFVPVSVVLLREGVWSSFAIPLLAIHINQILANYRLIKERLEKLQERESITQLDRKELAQEIEHSLKQSLKEKIQVFKNL